MASIERRTRGGHSRWCAAAVIRPASSWSRVFARKVDAERYPTTVEASKITGSTRSNQLDLPDHS